MLYASLYWLNTDHVLLKPELESRFINDINLWLTVKSDYDHSEMLHQMYERMYVVFEFYS